MAFSRFSNGWVRKRALKRSAKIEPMDLHLTTLSTVLLKSLIDRFPEWHVYVEDMESESEKSKRSLCVRVPSPFDANRFIAIRERGDCIEVSFNDGKPPGGAERLFICEPNDEEQCVAAAMQFVEQLTDEKIVIARKSLSWLFGKVLPPSFIAANEIEMKKGLVNIVSWRGAYDMEIGRG